MSRGMDWSIIAPALSTLPPSMAVVSRERTLLHGCTTARMQEVERLRRQSRGGRAPTVGALGDAGAVAEESEATINKGIN